MSEINDDRLREWYASIASHEPRDRRGCPAPEQLQGLVNREGGESSRLSVLDHVMTCGACRKEFDMLNALAHARQETESHSGRSRTFGSHPVRWAVTALAASVVFAVSVQVVQHRHQPDVLRDAQRKEPFATPGAQTATGTYPVSLITPTSATLDVTNGMTFTWHATAGALRYTIEVLDTDGASVFSASTSDTTMTFPNAGQKLNKSTHYQWWVRAANPSGIEQRSEMRELRVRDGVM